MRPLFLSLVVALLPPPTMAQWEVPRTWAEEEVKSFELPLAETEHSPRHVSEEYYQSLPVRTIYRSYPVYHPDHEPDGYLAELANKEPEVVFDADSLLTREDWVQAGELVFEAPIGFDGPIVAPSHLESADWWKEVDPLLIEGGVVPGISWVVREKGQVELGNLSCAHCHSRILADGTLVKGAQGNWPFEAAVAYGFEQGPEAVVRNIAYLLTAAPWIEGQDESFLANSKEQLLEAFRALPPGVVVRQGTSLFFPARIPDLIGLEERKYFDASGLVRHRGPGDVMRYAAVNQGMDMLASFGGFIPGAPDHQTLPEAGNGFFVGSSDRYSDAQLYALTLWLYSLEPPPNPNTRDELSQRGERVFRQQGCGECHTPPLYTNNQLIPAPGFEPPTEHYELYSVSRRRVDTDSRLTLRTRRGTGYYKIPSLLGVWYRSPLEHSGSIATLEDWFDPRRFDPDYRPTGWGPETEPRAVDGHPFGVTLPAEDKRALIAFLRTL